MPNRGFGDARPGDDAAGQLGASSSAATSSIAPRKGPSRPVRHRSDSRSASREAAAPARLDTRASSLWPGRSGLRSRDLACARWAGTTSHIVAPQRRYAFATRLSTWLSYKIVYNLVDTTWSPGVRWSRRSRPGRQAPEEAWRRRARSCPAAGSVGSRRWLHVAVAPDPDGSVPSRECTDGGPQASSRGWRES